MSTPKKPTVSADSTTPAPVRPPYRAGYRGRQQFFDTLAEAASHTAKNGGPVDELHGKVYRTISSRLQRAAEEDAS